MLQKKVEEKIVTNILCSVNFFSENHAIYEAMMKHRIEQCMSPMTIWCMHIACWVTKATDTHTICNTYCFSTATMVYMLLSITFTHALPLLFDPFFSHVVVYAREPSFFVFCFAFRLPNHLHCSSAPFSPHSVQKIFV